MWMQPPEFLKILLTHLELELFFASLNPIFANYAIFFILFYTFDCVCCP